MVIKRDKTLEDYNANDFVKYFLRKFREVNSREFPVVFARDCSIMVNIMRRFHEAGRKQREIFKFIDYMFTEYPKKKRIKVIDIQFLLGVTDYFLSGRIAGNKAENKVKTEFKMDDDLKAWLKQEKERWQKNQDV